MNTNTKEVINRHRVIATKKSGENAPTTIFDYAAQSLWLVLSARQAPIVIKDFIYLLDPLFMIQTVTLEDNYNVINYDTETKMLVLG